MTGATKAAATRRIRRRAAQWRAHREAAAQPLEAYAQRFRDLAEGNSFCPTLCPPHSPAQLREVFDSTIAERRKAIRYQLRERLRCTSGAYPSPHMASYHRESAVKALAGLRDVATARQALEVVIGELEGARLAA